MNKKTIGLRCLCLLACAGVGTYTLKLTVLNGVNTFSWILGE